MPSRRCSERKGKSGVDPIKSNVNLRKGRVNVATGFAHMSYRIDAVILTLMSPRIGRRVSMSRMMLVLLPVLASMVPSTNLEGTTPRDHAIQAAK